MSRDAFESLMVDLCRTIDLPAPDAVLERGWIEVDGFEVGLNHFDSDENAFYITYRFGVVVAGRALTIFRLMLESNLTVYAQDQGQMGMEGESGIVVLIVRIPITDEVTGEWLAETLTHYTEHGVYWQTNILNSDDDQFDAICAGEYVWIRS